MLGGQPLILNLHASFHLAPVVGIFTTTLNDLFASQALLAMMPLVKHRTSKRLFPLTLGSDALQFTVEFMPVSRTSGGSSA